MGGSDAGGIRRALSHHAPGRLGRVRGRRSAPRRGAARGNRRAASARLPGFECEAILINAQQLHQDREHLGHQQQQHGHQHEPHRRSSASRRAGAERPQRSTAGARRERASIRFARRQRFMRTAGRPSSTSIAIQISPMALNYEKLVNCRIPEVEQQLTKRDTMLYALGVGLGADPCDAQQLQIRLRGRTSSRCRRWRSSSATPARGTRRPTRASRAATSCTASRDSRSSAAARSKATVVGHDAKSTGVVDKGKDRGALVMTRTARCATKQAGRSYCTLTSTTFCRADGGFGGPAGPVREPHTLPESTPDATCDLPTLPAGRADLSVIGRLQPAARRSRLREEGRLQDADPARPLHVQRRRTCAAEDVLRLRPSG